MQTRAPRKIPQRTCISCRTTGDKRELIRIVRGPESVEVDVSGKKPGRGAYICHETKCWQEALRKGRLEAALRTRLSADDKLKLSEYVTTLNPVA